MKWLNNIWISVMVIERCNHLSLFYSTKLSHPWTWSPPCAVSDLCVDESQRLRSLGRPSWLTMLEKTSRQCTTYSECTLHVLAMSVGHFMIDTCEPAFSASVLDCPSDSWTQTVTVPCAFTRTLIIYDIPKSCLPSTIGPLAFIGSRLLLDSMTHDCDSTSNRKGV